jgi:hypothetical protein
MNDWIKNLEKCWAEKRCLPGIIKQEQSDCVLICLSRQGQDIGRKTN